jgi:hypothetical protein
VREKQQNNSIRRTCTRVLVMPTARPALLQVSLLAQSSIEQIREPDA